MNTCGSPMFRDEHQRRGLENKKCGNFEHKNKRNEETGSAVSQCLPNSALPSKTIMLTSREILNFLLVTFENGAAGEPGEIDFNIFI